MDLHQKKNLQKSFDQHFRFRSKQRVARAKKVNQISGKIVMGEIFIQNSCNS